MSRIVNIFTAIAFVLPAAASAAQTATLGWPEVIDDLTKERTQAETCVGLIKSSGDQSAIADAKVTYGTARAEMDGVIAGLTTVRASLESSGKSLKAICDAATKTDSRGYRAAMSPKSGHLAASSWVLFVSSSSLSFSPFRVHSAPIPSEIALTTGSIAPLAISSHTPLVLWAGLVVAPAVAQDQGPNAGTDLYDRPVLAVDPGMHTGKIRAQGV